MLLFLAGPRVRDIFRQLPDTGDDADFDTALAKLNKFENDIYPSKPDMIYDMI